MSPPSTGCSLGRPQKNETPAKSSFLIFYLLVAGVAEIPGDATAIPMFPFSQDSTIKHPFF